MLRWSTVEGVPFPMGAIWIEREQAYNFAIYSRYASNVTLLLFGAEDFVNPVLEQPLNPMTNKTHRIWHCRVRREDVPTARYYAYCIDGPLPGTPAHLHAFDPEKVLLDPYANDVFFPPRFNRKVAEHPGPNAGRAPLGVLPSPKIPFEWEDDHHPWHDADAVIYELHVRGFTRSASSGAAPERRGTFLGLIDKIPHLQDLGVTVVELMPIQLFDPQEVNYWGYMTLNFFTPHLGYATDPSRARDEFRTMVKALHAAGIEVILDVVYNHTTEGDHRGPIYSFKGVDNSTYYMMGDDPADPYLNYSGTGNTVHCANRQVRAMIVDSLHYWVTEMHVDGFRFDLASVFTRNSDGSINYLDPPLLAAIRNDPVLRRVHLIAEPWDAAGTYQLGTAFPTRFWHQWNGKFRDDVRRFLKGDPDTVSPLMRRIYGSDDLFPDRVEDLCRPYQGINYFASHDGFTLYDQVAYNERRNWANGNDNTDGHRDNNSWNCGHEGDEDVPPAVMALRRRQAKNFFCLLMLANGIPMFLAGDEFLQTQGGNNNPYNQDNETTWLDWRRLEANADHYRFVKMLIAFRKAHPSLCRSHYWREDVRWHGVGPEVDMGCASHSLAWRLRGSAMGDRDLYVMVNAWERPLRFNIQDWTAVPWRRVLDTSLPTPEDIVTPGQEVPVPVPYYQVAEHSVVVLMR